MNDDASGESTSGISPPYYKVLVEKCIESEIEDLCMDCNSILHENETVVDSYWIVPKFVKVCIVYNSETGRKKYMLLEPPMSKEELNLVNRMYKDIRKILVFSTSKEDETNKNKEESNNLDRINLIFKVFDDIINEYSIDLDLKLKYRIIYYLIRNFIGYNVIDGLMNDPHLEDISCDGYDIPLYVFHRIHGSMSTNIKIPQSYLDYFALLLCQKAEKFVSHANPLVDGTLPDGSRLQVTYGAEIAPRGTSFTIRRFRASPMTPVDLIKTGTMTAEILAYFWLLVENKMNFMIIGETASGKTTTLNALMMFIPPDAKVVSIEDTREIVLYHENWIAEVTRAGFGEQSGVSMYDLLRAALRQRPDYIIVGEIRGKEALTLFQAMSTGHAAYSTLHAGDLYQAIYRLENEPLNVPRIMIQFLDVIAVQSLWVFRGSRKRRTKCVNEIYGVDPNSKEMLASPIFQWDPATDSFQVTSESKKLEKIASILGVDVFSVREELIKRSEFLKLLSKSESIKDYRDFVKAIQQYYNNPEKAFEIYKGGT